jgi:hypothetical protein
MSQRAAYGSMVGGMDKGFAEPASGRRHDTGRSGRQENGGAGRTRSGDRSRPTLLVNPPSDMRLRETLDRTMDERTPGSPSELEALMRPEYPRIVVRARALEHESVVVWYVYREGYWVPAPVEDVAIAGAVAASSDEESA